MSHTTPPIAPLACAVLASSLASAVLAGASGAPTAAPLEVEQPILGVEVLSSGGRLDWSRQGDRLVYDRPDAARGGAYDLWIRDLDSGAERCLTCVAYDFRSAHALDPSWSPAGDLIVFQAQQHAKRLGNGRAELATPARALFSDLWLARADGKAYWQLTRLAERGSAVLGPHFSSEGDALVWSQRMVSRTGPWGLWQLRTAGIRMRRGVPALRSPQAHEPPQVRGLIVAEGFMPDDRRLLLSAERRPGSATDIGIWDPATQAFEALTASAAGDDASPRVSPRGDLLVWVADAGKNRRGPSVGGTELPAREVWMLSLADGSRRPLTHFNESGPHGLGRTWVGDLAWSPDGDRLAVQVIHGSDGREEIVLLELHPAFRR